VDHAQFLAEFQKILENPVDGLEGSERLEDIGWDSLALMSFIAMVDEQIGRELSPRDVGRCETVDDLYKLATNGA
jgi:acyl carrier protein